MARLTKSSYVKIVLVCLLCLMICGTLTGGFAFTRHVVDTWTSPWEEEHRWTPDDSDELGGFSVDATSVRSISINWLAGSVDIHVVPDVETNGMIQVSETENARVPLRWRSNDGELQIDYGSVHHAFGCHWFDTSSKKLTVLVPQSSASTLGTLCLNAASGEYFISDLNCDYLNINQASGRVRVSGVTTERASFAVASGFFEYRGDVTSALEIDQASGQSALTLQTANPTTGDLSMASGSMRLALPSADFQLGLNKLSGNFDCDYDMFSRGDTYFGSAAGIDQAGSHLYMDMLSGDFHVVKTD